MHFSENITLPQLLIALVIWLLHSRLRELLTLKE